MKLAHNGHRILPRLNSLSSMSQFHSADVAFSFALWVADVAFYLVLWEKATSAE